jgi:predicted nucleic acid-binding Zn ribbon protein
MQYTTIPMMNWSTELATLQPDNSKTHITEESTNWATTRKRTTRTHKQTGSNGTSKGNHSQVTGL